MEYDTEQGLGSMMLGSGSDWPASVGPYPSEEEYKEICAIAIEMGRRAGEQLNQIIKDAYGVK